MPRQLALVLCAFFVLYLLRFDRRQSRQVSWAIWISTAWMLVTASKSIDQWLGISGGSRETGGILDPVFQSGLLLLGLVVLSQRRLNWPEVRKDHVWLILLISFMFVSILWSDSVFIAFKRWIRELTAVVMGLSIVSERDPREAMLSLLRRTVYVLIPSSVLLIKYYHDMGVGYNRWTGDVVWVGVTLQKNGLGRLCLISAFFLLWTFLRRWQKRDVAVGRYQIFAELLLVAMTVWMFKGPSTWAASSTAIASFAVGLAVYFGLLWMRKHRIKLSPNTWVIIVGCIIGVGIVTPFVGGSTVTGFTSMLGRNETLTGRTEIWASLLPAAMRQPFLGYGVSSFFTAARIAQFDIGEAHNGYLEVMLCLGVVGLFLTTMFLLSSTRRAAMLLAHDSDYDMGSLALCFLVMAAVHNMAESSFDSFTRQLMAVVLFLSLSLSVATNRRLGLGRSFAPANYDVPIETSAKQRPVGLER